MGYRLHMYLYTLQDAKQFPMKLPTAVVKLNHNCGSNCCFYRTITCVGLCGEKLLFGENTVLMHKYIATCIGVQRDISFERCSCTSEAQIILRAGFFPATAAHPRLAFSLELLDLLEALLLQCQVAIQDSIVAALHYLHRPYADHTLVVLVLTLHKLIILFFQTYRSLYPVLVDCFEEYRLV